MNSDPDEKVKLRYEEECAQWLQCLRAVASAPWPEGFVNNGVDSATLAAEADHMFVEFRKRCIP